MTTRNLVPRGDGEGGIGKPGLHWGYAGFKTGNFEEVNVDGNQVLTGYVVTQSDVTGHEAALTISESQISDLGSYITDYTVTESDVTGYQAALTISESQISDLGAYITDYTVTESDVTGHQVAITISESQISDLGAYITDYTVTEPDVTGHQAALSITTSQISDFNSSQNYQPIEQDGSIIVEGGINFSGHILPATNADFDIGSAEKKIRHLFLSDNSLKIGENISISAEGDVLNLPSGIKIGQSSVDSDDQGRLVVSEAGFLVGQAAVKPDPDNPESLYFESIPQAQDDEGNVVTILTADKLGLGTASVLTGIDQDIKFKLLTDQERFVVGTTGQGNLPSGWYRFNDFKVKGATDIGAHPINPVDTRIYSDESSFILFTTDTAGNRVAHLVGGEEEVNANNAIALGIAVKVDDGDSPSDIEFVHTDGESYSVINGDSDSLGTNRLPIRQGFQNPSIGSNPSPLLIDGGYF